jgi:hypothetical protein
MDAMLQRHLDLAWDWWTEMGVAGSRGVPVETTLHPEALVVFTAPLVRFDARLREGVIGWLLAHGRLLGARQVLAVANRLPAAPAAMADFTATLRRAGGPAWVGHQEGHPIDGTYQPLSRGPDVGRPALALLRLRAVLGVDARSEVVAVLGDDTARALTHADLAMFIASTPRNVRLALEDLVLGGAVTVSGRSGSQRYRCAQPDALRAWIGSIPALPPWPTLLPALTAMRQALIAGGGDVERSVNVQRMLDHHANNLNRFALPPFPHARGRALAGAAESWLLEVEPVVRSGVDLVA